MKNREIKIFWYVDDAVIFMMNKVDTQNSSRLSTPL